MASLRILIVDDHEVIRRGLRSLLSSRPEWEICGEAADGQAAVEKVGSLQPDLVLMDVTMPVMTGTEATRAIRSRQPETKVIIISQNEPEVTRRLAREAGAAAYVAKSDLSRDLLSTIDKITVEPSPPEHLAAPLPQKKREKCPPWLPGGGDMGALMRSKDWSQTVLGPIEKWPRSLQVSVGICVSSRFDLIVWWGPDLVMLYNDSYRRTLGRKHPEALGRPGREVYREVWDVAGPMLEHVLKTGEATWSDNLMLLLERSGYPEETYHTFSYTPIRDEQGRVVGVITPVAETTEQVISQRRLFTLRELASRSVDAKNEPEAWEFAAKALNSNPYDIPFAVLYKLNYEQLLAEAAAFTGIAPGHPFLPDTVLWKDDSRIAQLIRDVIARGEMIECGELDRMGVQLPGGFWGGNVTNLVLVPVTQAGVESGMGVLVAGVNRHKRLDEDYRGFISLVANQIAKSVADARIVDGERRRAESLAELDRAKTTFFSNISHELRTPLTLILGPLEELLERTRGSHLIPTNPDEIELIHRNASRLLKLVNTLLDFSRIEAGRMQAKYEPVRLGELTAELASAFRSAVEKAGLEFDVRCEEPAATAFVDRQMWEKVVLNLLSNALKFTHSGRITVGSGGSDGIAEFRVEDTGVGIPKSEMPHLFERFHRIEGTPGRTNEGTGIGLALVQELVKLHGGTIRAQSELGRGSQFIVSIPTGSNHLPQDRVVASEDSTTPPSRGASQFLKEALGWLPPNRAEEINVNDQPAIAAPPEILLVEDNSDMRLYLERLLKKEGFVVTSAPDGVAALERVDAKPPDLVLSDAMLPRLDGMTLLKRLRENSSLNDLPIILLSARVGEEFRNDALQAGATDYLVKPFHARELVARVKLHWELAGRKRASGEKSRLQLGAAPMGTWDFDLLTNQAFWSPGLFALLGYTAGGCTPSWNAWMERVHPENREAIERQWKAAISERQEYHFDYQILLPDGNVRWVEANGRFYFDDTGRPYRDLGTLREISPQREVPSQDPGMHSKQEKQEQEERRALEERLTEVSSQAELLDLVTDGALICDTSHKISYWNRAAERLYGWSAPEAVGQDVTSLLQTEYPVPFAELLATLEENGRWEGELVHTTRHGMRVVVYSRWIHKRGERGEFKGWLEINADLTQQRQAEETARRLSGRILQLQDEERRKMARELHDSVGQYLAMLKITIDRSGSHDGVDRSSRQALAECSKLVDQCISETRTMSYLLHPPLLDENGLLSAVRWYVEGFAARSGIEVHVNAPNEMPRLVKESETALFRILQESLTNVHRHSQSKSVSVDIFCDTHTVSLRVKDFGKGIPLERIRSFRDRGSGMGVGLGGMRERVRELGGILRIEPGEPVGTVISVEIPLIESRNEFPLSRLPELSNEGKGQVSAMVAQATKSIA